MATVRLTRHDPGSGLTNGDAAAVESIDRDGVRFRLGNGSVTKLGQCDPQLQHIDRASAATVHAFKGRAVDRILAAMPTGNAQLTNQLGFHRLRCVERLRGRTRVSRLSKSDRQAILDRDGGQCVKCGNDEDLQVDHVTPAYAGGTDDPDNLQTLCGEHHREKTSEDAADPQNNAELVRRIREGRGW